MSHRKSPFLLSTVLFAACATNPEEPVLSADERAELRAIADVLSRPHDFPHVDGRGGGGWAFSYPADLGCLRADARMPSRRWQEQGTNGVYVKTAEPGSLDEELEDEVARACFRLERLGAAGLLREELERIVGDEGASPSGRLQAIHALGSIGDERACALLVDLLGDEFRAHEAMMQLHRNRATGLRVLAAAARPASDAAKQRIGWLLGRNGDAVDATDVEWLCSQLTNADAGSFAWALVRIHALRHDLVESALLPFFLDAKEIEGVWVVAASVHVVDRRIRECIVARAKGPPGPVRQFALQALPRVGAVDVEATLLALLRDAGADHADRAAAAVACAQLLDPSNDLFDALSALLDHSDLHLVRAALLGLTGHDVLPEAVREHVLRLESVSDMDVQLLRLGVLQG